MEIRSVPCKWQTRDCLLRTAPVLRDVHKICARSAFSGRAVREYERLGEAPQHLVTVDLPSRWHAFTKASVNASTGLWAALGVPPLLHNLQSLSAGQTGAIVDQGWLVLLPLTALFCF